MKSALSAEKSRLFVVISVLSRGACFGVDLKLPFEGEVHRAPVSDPDQRLALFLREVLGQFKSADKAVDAATVVLTVLAVGSVDTVVLYMGCQFAGLPSLTIRIDTHSHGRAGG